MHKTENVSCIQRRNTFGSQPAAASISASCLQIGISGATDIACESLVMPQDIFLESGPLYCRHLVKSSVVILFIYMRLYYDMNMLFPECETVIFTSQGTGRCTVFLTVCVFMRPCGTGFKMPKSLL